MARRRLAAAVRNARLRASDCRSGSRCGECCAQAHFGGSGRQVQRAAGKPGACAVPVDGISPNDATVASGAYPHTQRVYWVTKKKQPKYERTVRRAYEKYLFGTVGDQFLGTVGQRDRLRP